jgi:hypothetical protein
MPKKKKKERKKEKRTLREARLFFLGNVIAKPNPINYKITYGIGTISSHTK